MKEEKYWILMSKKIAGEATPEELEQLQELIDGNSEWKTIGENLQEIWNSKPADQDHDNRRQKTEDAYLVHINQLKEIASDFKSNSELFNNEARLDTEPRKKPFYARWAVYAVASVFIAGIIILVYPHINESEKASKAYLQKPINEITVNPGAKTKLRLPDGTYVWVNSDSKLSYPETFKGPLREVYLEGEAYFDVAEDASHPFIVHTSGIDIRVIGTVFNVKAYKAEPTIEATLIHGIIEVTKPNQTGVTSKMILKPHEKLIFNKSAADNGINKKQQIENNNLSADELKSPVITIAQIANDIVDSAIVETSWVYNRLSFEDEKFENIAVKMERWFNVKIRINGDRIKKIRLTGSFEKETVEEALKELQYLVPFGYTISGREIEINKK